MEWLSDLALTIKQELWLISWRDILEILFFSSVIYRIIRWLNHDKQKNLVLGFYSYISIFFLSYYLNISGITFFLLVSAPAIAMLFILLHQKTLQRNYVALKSTPTSPEIADRWIEELLQAFLHGVNKNRHMIGIIERKAHLEPFFIARCLFNTPISRELLTLLTNSTQTEEIATFWVNEEGKLIAFNPIWNVEQDEIWLAPDLKIAEKHKQDAAVISQQSDAIIIFLSPENRLFDVIFEGKRFENISAGYSFSLIKQFITQMPKPKGLNYEAPHTRNNQPFNRA
ncbi:MAG: hypothetical protein UV79_C0001G0050 [candidate division TM6 bacterium GW2011_GWF2_43_17]|nr:MAG: hypothetical protein UV79_C0001G0050 [candidate division TM6 bacterium GW2011_GWF2_43_17]HAU30314.1 hypothetical protein [Candidatus Dependentiae bacterium]